MTTTPDNRRRDISNLQSPCKNENKDIKIENLQRVIKQKPEHKNLESAIEESDES